MWMPGSCSRRGFGLTPEDATHRALVRALNAVLPQFNAAELDFTHVAQYPGFCVAIVTMHPREVKESTAVEVGHQMHPQATNARQAADRLA